MKKLDIALIAALIILVSFVTITKTIMEEKLYLSKEQYLFVEIPNKKQGIIYKKIKDKELVIVYNISSTSNGYSIEYKIKDKNGTEEEGSLHSSFLDSYFKIPFFDINKSIRQDKRNYHCECQILSPK